MYRLPCLCSARFSRRFSGSYQLSESFRDGLKDQTSDAQLRIGESQDSQERKGAPEFDASHRPGMTLARQFPLNEL
jgi:hypothetical protein